VPGRLSAGPIIGAFFLSANRFVYGFIQQTPLSPCGTCRQALLEIQLQQQQSITIYMTSPAGEVIIVEAAAYLLPFHFSNEQL